jgi:hypothetical protein
MNNLTRIVESFDGNFHAVHLMIAISNPLEIPSPKIYWLNRIIINTELDYDYSI